MVGGNENSSPILIATLRNLISDALSYQGVMDLCFDIAPIVFRQIPSSMQVDKVLNILIPYLISEDKIPELIKYIKEKNSHQFHEYEAQIRSILGQ